MSLQYLRSLSSSKYLSNNNFYSTSFRPISYYSSISSQISHKNKRSINSFKPKNNYSNETTDDSDINSINIFKTRIHRTKPSAFYMHEKSLRLQDEIDWINRLVFNKSNINFNKLMRINPTYINKTQNIVKYEDEKDMEINQNLINNIRIENLNKIMKINNRLKNSSVLLNKRSLDNYNYKNFMYQMNKFKNNELNKWKNDFHRKFNEY